MRTRRMLCAVLVCAVALFLAVKLRAAAAGADDGATASVSPETRDAVQRLIGDSILNGKAYDYDEDLSDMIGPRLTGSANYMRAADGAVHVFKSIGLANVHTEEWTIPSTWEPEGPATGYLISPVEHILHIYSLGWSPSTPKEGVTGEVVYIPSVAPDALEAQKAQIAGKIALLDTASYGPKPTLGGQLGGLDRLRALHPMALVSTGSFRGTESMSALQFAGTLTAMPQAQIGLEDSLLIKRLLARGVGNVVMHFSFTNNTRANVAIPNVIAEIPGTEHPDEVVIIGAHLDSWQPGTGAQDNGTGAATVMEAARAIKALNRPPRRTIRFILFGGEEQGLLGSNAYVRQHMAELAKIDAVLVTDSGDEPALGWYVMARDDEANSLAAIRPLLANLGADGISTDSRYIYQTDHAAFDVLGVPTLVLWNPQDKYNTLHHKASDTFDAVDRKDLTQGVTVVTVTAYAIADSRETFAPHLSPADMQAALKAHDVLDGYTFLKANGDLP